MKKVYQMYYKKKFITALAKYFSYLPIKTFIKSTHKNHLSEVLLMSTNIFTTHIFITKTYLYNADPLKPHFYIIKLGFTGGMHYFSYFYSKI